MITIVLRVKTSLHEIADECLTLFGEGSRPFADREENYFALNNTTVQNGYVRIAVAQHIAMALEYVLTEYTSVNADLIEVEWLGQTQYEIAPGAYLGVLV